MEVKKLEELTYTFLKMTSINNPLVSWKMFLLMNHIEDKVLTADRVFISDHGHQYEDPSRPIMDQGVVTRGPVVIGQGSWLGENVAVISSRIGRHCVIGANSVVLNDIPDYSIAVGAPARVIRTFNPRSNAWEKTPPSTG